jgi:hypothetical protein
MLLARHGRLIYEAYGDEIGAVAARGSNPRQVEDAAWMRRGCGVDAAWMRLRNTRSATKTLTGMPIGIAIEHGYLDGVSSPVLLFFPEKQPVHYDDPHKAAITIEGSAHGEFAPRMRRQQPVLAWP